MTVERSVGSGAVEAEAKPVGLKDGLVLVGAVWGLHGRRRVELEAELRFTTGGRGGEGCGAGAGRVLVVLVVEAAVGASGK